MRSSSALVFAAFTALMSAVTVSGHMMLTEPVPFRSKDNKNLPDQSTVDWDMVRPLAGDGSDFPCKGHHQDFGTPAGAPTATYQPGGSYSIKLYGSGQQSTHLGGSCQLSLSFDGGKTFEVIKSYIGNCPADPNATLDFTMPADVQNGNAIFAWTWFNNTGNREMYMNCAAVTIGGGGGSKRKRTDIQKRGNRPGIFIANIGPPANGCATTEHFDVEFPEPGDDVSRSPGRDGAATGPPTGCAGGNGGGNGGGAAAAGGAAAGGAAAGGASAGGAAAPGASAAVSPPAQNPSAPDGGAGGAGAPTDGAATPSLKPKKKCRRGLKKKAVTA